MTTNDLEAILHELYDIDPALRSRDSEIRERIHDFSLKKFPRAIRPEFVTRLRREVLDYDPPRSTVNKIYSFIFNRFSMRNKGFALGGLALGVIVLAFVATMYRPEATLGAELAYTEGAVLYRTGGGVWQEAKSGTSLGEGDGVKVIGVGRAVINLDDGSALRINNDSEVTLSALDPEHMQIINEYGQVYSRVVKSKTRAFDVNVKGTFYRALGTAYMTVNTDETQGVEVYHSAVQVIDEGLTSDETKAVVPEGSAYYEANVNAPKKVDEVTAISTEQVAGNDFVVWNKEQDEADENFESQLGVLAVVDTDSAEAPDSTTGETKPEDVTAPATGAETASTNIVLTAAGTNALTWTAPE